MLQNHAILKLMSGIRMERGNCVFTFRKATLRDVESVLKARIDFLYDRSNITTEQQGQEQERVNRDYIESAMADGTYVEWLAMDGEKIAGTGGLTFYRLLPHAERPTGAVAYIDNVFTYPEYRGKGIANKLLDLIVQTACEYGCDLVLLDATEMGRPIYEKYGFKNMDGNMMLRCNTPR